MIGKITKGRGFRGLAEYLLRGGRGQIVAGPMAGRTPRELAAEFGQFRRLNPKLGKAVAHFSLSPAPDDPPLTESQWQAIAERFMSEMGFDGAWCGIVHRDTDHHHLHLMGCRIDMSGKTVSDANDYRRAEAVIRSLERDYGLIAVPDPPRKKTKPTPTTTTRGAREMTDTNTTSANPFEPGDPRHDVWPNGFDPGCALAELAAIETWQGVVATSASTDDDMSERKRREMRRLTVESSYEHSVRALFGSELRAVHKFAGGAILYFHDGRDSRIADRGDRLVALGDISEEAAAKRIVAMALSPERNWRSITFTGSPKFVELAMREAMSHGMQIKAKGPEQEAILAKLEAEKRGGMGAMSAMAGPAIENDPILAPLAELDEISAQTSTRTAPPPAPVAQPPASPNHQAQPPRSPVVGVFPAFPNLRERLKERREWLASTQPKSPQQTPPKLPRPKGP